MKTIIATSVMTAFLLTGFGALAQNQGEDYLGLPGDNLNLYAVMKLFQESQTLEEFERNLNDESSRINNLDLNGDSQIDYISVYDNVNGNVHNIVLQVAINQRERQDVAVFTVGRDSEGNVWLQLTGDEALYGKNYIIEPILDNVAETPNPGYTGTATTVNGRRVTATTVTPVRTTTVVNVVRWPLVTYIYSPAYVVWRSPWYWGYYPPYWRTWRPYYWHYYYGYHYHWYPSYYTYYHRSYYHRNDYWNRYYYRPHYTYSRVVTRNISSGSYRATYSRPDERSKGEALYVSTYGNNNRRQQSVSTTTASTDRRNTAATTNNRTTVNSSSNATRRDASATTATRTETRPANSSASTTRRTDATTQRSATQANTPERSSVQPSTSNTRSSSSNVRSSSARTSQSESKASTPARSSNRSNESRAAARTRTESSSGNSSSNSGSSESRSSSRSGRR